jgi:hypothetical protein
MVFFLNDWQWQWPEIKQKYRIIFGYLGFKIPYDTLILILDSWVIQIKTRIGQMFASKVSKETTFHKMSLRQEGSTANSWKKM